MADAMIYGGFDNVIPQDQDPEGGALSWQEALLTNATSSGEKDSIMQTAQALQESQLEQQNQLLGQSQQLAGQAGQAQQNQLALLGFGTDEQKAQALQSVQSSPLAQAVLDQNRQAVAAQSAASGISGGNLLTALQQANQSALLGTAFQGLGQVGAQQQQGALGFGGLAQGFGGLSQNALNTQANVEVGLEQAKAAKAAADAQADAANIQALGGIAGVALSFLNPFD